MHQSQLLLKLHSQMIHAEDAHTALENCIKIFIDECIIQAKLFQSLQIVQYDQNSHRHIASCITYDIYKQSHETLDHASQRFQEIQQFIENENKFLTKLETESTSLTMFPRSPFIQQNYIDLHIQSVILTPIQYNHTVIGWISYGTRQTMTEPHEKQITLAEEFASIISLLYKQIKTEKNLTEITQNLYTTNAQLHQLDKMKDQLIAVTSHELRTPASVVQNYLWMVLNKPTAGTVLADKDKERIQASFDENQILIKLINDILDVSKIEGGKMSIKLEPLKYKEVITQVVKDLDPKLKEKGLALQITDNCPTEILALDSLRFKEIITNLFSNAIKYTEKGSIAISLSTQPDNQVAISITDTGRGISPEFLPKLFKKFYREDTSLQSSNADTGGTGLGLYITKSIVELMGGTITVSSTLGNGTTFTITFPTTTQTLTQPTKLSPSAEQTNAPSTTTPQTDQSSQRNVILLVEDEPDLRELYSEFLSERYDIVTAQNGIEGLEYLRQNPNRVSIILLDIMMPKMDGVSFLQERNKNPNLVGIPVVLLTNLTHDEIITKCKNLGAKGVIIKSQITPDKIPPIIDPLLH